MIISALLSFYNKKEMLDTTDAKNRAQEMKKRLRDIFADNLRGIDLGLRGYVITKDEKMLDPYLSSIRDTKINLIRIDSILVLQGLDSSLNSFKKLKLEINNYLIYADQMKLEAKKEDNSKFKKMLALDKGYDLYRVFAPFETSHNKYEDEVIIKAEKGYEKAMNRNIVLQLVLLVISLPVLAIMIYRIDKENDHRKGLLFQLEKNNRQYLFNEGTEIDTSSVKKIVENSIQNFIKANQFITHISEGNYDIKWEGLNNQNLSLNEGNLVGRLIKMRDEMKHVKMEDQKRNWINEGLTKFSTIVRNNQIDLNTLSDKSLQFLTKYLNASQGSLFIANPEKRLDLNVCYAYNKKIDLEKSIEIGEGMIGQVYLEEKAIVLKKIPKGYIEVKSGEVIPNCLMIVPLKYNDIVAAIVELAGTENFEEHKIKFIEKAGEILAAAILNVETTQQMKNLLEESEEQRQIMIAQEAEMRTYVQDIEITKEEMYRKNREMEETILALKLQVENNAERI